MQLKLFSGSSHPQLAAQIAAELHIQVAASTSVVFSNDNRFVKIDEPVRGADVYVVQTSRDPVDAHLMELLMIIRTLRDASAERITAVMPYFAYARSDKKDQPRICLTARLVADLLESAGADRVLIMEMHSAQLQGFFSIPCDHLLGAPPIIRYLLANERLDNYVLVAGDAGAAKIVKHYADALQLPVAIMDKRRASNDEQPFIKGVIGDVNGKRVLLIDDEMSSGRTLIRDAEFLLASAGASGVEACVVHPVLGGNAVAELNQSQIGRFFTTNTIPTVGKALRNHTVIDVAPTFAECIRRLSASESIHSLNQLALKLLI